MSLNCKKSEDVLKLLKDDEFNFVDLRFTDPRGKWQHLTMTSEFIDEDSFTDGIMFDGSSIAGWKAINESDMSLVPDATTAVMDPFAAQPQMILVCDIWNQPPASPMAATRVRLPKRPRLIWAPPASVTPLISVRNPNSSSSTMSGSMCR